MKKKLVQNVISCIVTFSLAASLFGAPAVLAFADDASDAGGTNGGAANSSGIALNTTGSNATLGEYKSVDTSSVDSVFFYDGELTMDFHWRDEFFYGNAGKGSNTYCLGDSTVYNPSLATMSAQMAWAGFNYVQNPNGKNDYTMGYKRLLELTSQCGFSNFQANDDYKKVPGAMTVGVGIASKEIDVPGEGKRTLITVTQRSGSYGSEWSSNTTLGTSGEAKGFATGRDEVIDNLIIYFNKYGDQITQNPKIWITGYSRGSAIGNLSGNFIDVAIQAEDGSSNPLMKNKHMADMRALAKKFNIKTEDVYSYGIEVPKGGVKECAASNTKNLHCCVDPNDAVPYVAPTENWNFQWYGQVHNITVHTPDTVREDLKDERDVKQRGGADRTSDLYVKELAKIDADEAKAFENSDMRMRFTPRMAASMAAFLAHAWGIPDETNVVGSDFPEFFSTLMKRLTEACGKRSDYNEGLQKTVAVLSKVVMNSETGGKAMDATIDAVVNRFSSNLGLWLMGTYSSVSKTWKTTETAALWIAYIASIGHSPNPKLVDDQIAQSKDTVCSLMKAAYKDLYEARIIDEDDLKDLNDSVEKVYPLVIKFIARDNEDDFQVITTALTYAGGLVTFHMPPYVTAHLRMNDPLYSTLGDESYKLDVLPVNATPNYSPFPTVEYSKDVAVDVIGVKGEVRTPLAKVRDGKIAYYSTCTDELKECIVASASKTGLISVQVKDALAFGASFDKAEFEVSNIREGKTCVDKESTVSVNLSYGYYVPGMTSRTTQGLEKGLVKLLNGDRLVMTCESGSATFSDAWYYSVYPQYVDKDFQLISTDVNVGKVFLTSDPSASVDLSCLPGGRNVALQNVTTPSDDPSDNFTTCELTSSPNCYEDGSYKKDSSGAVSFKRLSSYANEPTCGEAATGVFEPAYQQHSLNLYVVCTKKYNFTLGMVQSEMENGQVKTSTVTVPNNLDGVSIHGSLTGDITVGQAISGMPLCPGEKVSISVLKKVDTNFSDHGTITVGGKAYRVEGWQFDSKNKELSPVLISENEGRETHPEANLGANYPGIYTRISFIMPSHEVHLDSVLRNTTDDPDSQLFSFAGSLEITDSDKSKVNPEQIGLVPVSSDVASSGMSASDLAASNLALKTYKITNSENDIDSSVKFPVTISITAPDKSASGAAEYSFDHWATYYDSNSSSDDFKFITKDSPKKPKSSAYESGTTVKPKYKLHTFPFSVGSEQSTSASIVEELNNELGSLRFAPVYKEKCFSIVMKDAFGNVLVAPDNLIPQGQVPVLEYSLPNGSGEGSCISGVEGTYVPADSTESKKFTDFEAVSRDGNSLGEGCQEVRTISTMPKGDVTLTVKTSHNVYVKYADEDPQLVGAFEAGKPVNVDLAVPFDHKAAVSSDDADVALGANGISAVIGTMPAKPVTISVTTEALDHTQSLSVVGGTVYLDGKDEAIKPKADGTYAVARNAAVKIVPDPEKGKLFDKWNVSVADGSYVAACVAEDGALYFGMPDCAVTVKALFGSSVVEKNATFVLDGMVKPGSKLPMKATTTAPGIKEKSVAITWSTDPATPVQEGKTYTAKLTVHPAEHYSFPGKSQLKDMFIRLVVNEQVVRCTSLKLNDDGSLTVACGLYVQKGGSVTPVSPTDPDPKPKPAMKITSAKLTKTKRAYTGKAIVPGVVVKSGSKTLTKNVDYTVKCYNSASKSCTPKKIGAYKVRIIGKGKYAGSSFTRTFKIVPPRVTKVKVTAKKKGFKAKWKKLSKAKATGYQVRWSKSSKFKKYSTSTVKKRTVVSKKKTKLKAKKTYYVKVRAYKVVNGKKYYGAWSKVKKVKTKK